MTSKVTIGLRFKHDMYAVPKIHPVTCANPAPWLIQEINVDFNPIRVWIRNENSMWFRADQCDLWTKEEIDQLYAGHDLVGAGVSRDAML